MFRFKVIFEQKVHPNVRIINLLSKSYKKMFSRHDYHRPYRIYQPPIHSFTFPLFNNIIKKKLTEGSIAT